MTVERNFSLNTRIKYEEAIRMFARLIGDFPLSEMQLPHFISFKAAMAQRGAKEARTAVIVNAVKCLLIYAQDVLGIPILDLSRVKTPHPPRRTVSYLTKEEVSLFLSSIPLRAWTGKPRITGYRFRALAEVLASSGMRISEALALTRDSVNFEKGEAVIIGKGNKQRTVYFSKEALTWVQRYIDLRTDSSPFLFALPNGSPWQKGAVEATFRRIAKYAGFERPVTPHILRHTTATTLLQNGCPIGFIKEIMGHTRLETTCRYYLGILDGDKTHEAFNRYQDFGVTISS